MVLSIVVAAWGARLSRIHGLSIALTMPRVSAVPKRTQSGVPQPAAPGQPEHCARDAAAGLPGPDARQDIPALDEQLAIEGDADGLRTAPASLGVRASFAPASLDRLNDGEF